MWVKKNGIIDVFEKKIRIKVCCKLKAQKNVNKYLKYLWNVKNKIDLVDFFMPKSEAET